MRSAVPRRTAGLRGRRFPEEIIIGPAYPDRPVRAGRLIVVYRTLEMICLPVKGALQSSWYRRARKGKAFYRSTSSLGERGIGFVFSFVPRKVTLNLGRWG